MTIRLQSLFLLSMLTAALGLVFSSGDAWALSQPRILIQNATGDCRSALPVFEGQIRKRPLGFENEGTATAFVSCSLMASKSVAGITLIEVLAGNSTSSEIELTCTLISGVSNRGNLKFLPKTVRIDSTLDNLLIWSPADNSGTNFNFTINLSCALPAGTNLSAIFVSFDEEVGA